MSLVLSGTSGVALDNIKNNLMSLSTAQNTTSGTSIDFLNIPSWAKKITMMFNGVSTNGTSAVQVQIGSGSVDATNYAGVTITYNSVGNAASAATTGILLDNGTAPTAAATRVGQISCYIISSNTWLASGVYGYSNTTIMGSLAYSKSLAGTLDRIRITTVNGTDTFDAGSVNILIEGYV